MKKALFLATFFLFGLISCNSQGTSNAPDTPDRPVGYENIDVEAFKAKINQPDAVLLDVRTPEETAQGMIEGAIQLDFRSPDFESEIEKLDKDKTYLIYCRSGNRSGKTCALMAKKGYKNLYNLAGGYIAWSKK